MAIRQSNARHTRMFCALTNESGSMRNICPTARQPASVTATSVVSNMPTGDNIMDTDRKLRAGYGRCMPGEQQSCITLRKNEVQVSATGEVSLAPDRCRITIAISSRKEEAQDAVTSVDRRREYIMQTLHNYKISDEDVKSSKLLQRREHGFQYDAEINVQFDDFVQCQTICNFLTAKLDDNVWIVGPDFYHLPSSLEHLRRQASLDAVKNAKRKAEDMAACVGASVGQVISVAEESCSEWQGTDGPADLPVTMQQKLAQATISVTVKVLATFEMRTGRATNLTMSDHHIQR